MSRMVLIRKLHGFWRNNNKINVQWKWTRTKNVCYIMHIVAVVRGRWMKAAKIVCCVIFSMHENSIHVLLDRNFWVTFQFNILSVAIVTKNFYLDYPFKFAVATIIMNMIMKFNLIFRFIALFASIILNRNTGCKFHYWSQSINPRKWAGVPHLSNIL